MPVYTNPETGQKIRSDEPLSPEEIEEAFGMTSEAPSPAPVGQPEKSKAKGFGREFLENFAPTAALANPGQTLSDLGNVVSGLSLEEALAPMLPVGRGIVEGLKDRARPFFEQGQDTIQHGMSSGVGPEEWDPEGAMARLGQGTLASLPVLGEGVEPANRMLLDPDEDEQFSAAGAMLGQVGNMALPFGKEIGPSIKAGPLGKVPGSIKSVATNPKAQALALGGLDLAMSGNPLQSLMVGGGRLAGPRMVRGLGRTFMRGMRDEPFIERPDPRTGRPSFTRDPGGEPLSEYLSRPTSLLDSLEDLPELVKGGVKVDFEAPPVGTNIDRYLNSVDDLPELVKGGIKVDFEAPPRPLRNIDPMFQELAQQIVEQSARSRKPRVKKP